MERHFGSFIWDSRKEAYNIRKHGVDFEAATRAFKDSSRKIYIDEKHGEAEERLFCLGKVEGKILTVRFTYREGKIRIYGAGYWRKGRRYYEQAND
ncbi:MAG: BrnT family toxin [Candidatus Omnitrophica bacterium]|nr:BrnT family toxin [Candidatus Omnitrophota bacterium]MBI3010766.1 BrnT family toxin [Candidatus Omnitrophota bacterium]